jgi:hypothetical protein
MSNVYNEEIKGTATGNFFKWETVGQEFEGVFLRIGQGVNKRQPDKPLFHGVFRKLDTGAEVQVNAPTELLNKLQSVQPGAQLFIRYTGQAPSARGGFPKKTFMVMKAGAPGAQAPAPPPVSNGYAVVPQAPTAPPVPQQPQAITVPYLVSLLTQHVGESSAKLMVGVLANQTEAEQIRMLTETLTRNYGVKL